MRRPFFVKRIKILLLIVCAAAGNPARALAAEFQGRIAGAATKIRLGTPVASLSYLPIHVALKKGFFAKRGFDVEVMQMAAGLVTPALLNRAIDYTWNEREGTIDIIAKWMNLNVSRAGRAYYSVRDTYSKNGIPFEEQAKAYIAMLGATAGHLKGDVAASSICDFSLAAEAAKEMTRKK
jgi:hypothetical protein